jgi:hypothetical protein
MKEIPLTKGFVALVDDDDYALVSGIKWYATQSYAGKFYARGVIAGQPGMVYMHRLILGFRGSEDIDHINGNSLDNQRANLRVCTRSQNNQNQKRKPSRTAFKGVFPGRAKNRWAAKITVSGRQFYLGMFDSQEEAARAYDKAALEHFGSCARLNFGKEGLDLPEGFRVEFTEHLKIT